MNDEQNEQNERSYKNGAACAAPILLWFVKQIVLRSKPRHGI